MGGWRGWRGWGGAGLVQHSYGLYRVKGGGGGRGIATITTKPTVLCMVRGRITATTKAVVCTL